jgi:pimeloyl-[acyl-carrier protein] synthase
MNVIKKWNPFENEYKKNPYKNYKQLMEDNSTYQISSKIEMIMSYDMIVEILNNDNFIAPGLQDEISRYCPTFKEIFSNWLFVINGKKHLSARKFIMRHWNVDKLKNNVDEIVKNLINKTSENELDIADKYAKLIPTYAMIKYFNQDFNISNEIITYASLLQQVIELFNSKEDFLDIEKACLKFKCMLIEELESGSNVFFNQLFDCLDSNDDRKNVFASIIMMIYTTTIFTTSAQILLSTHALLKSPIQKEYFINNYSQKNSSIIQEFLRYDSPVQLVSRVNIEEAKIEGKTFDRGTHFFLNLGAANRDKTNFPDPDCLKLNRPYMNNLAFGGGAHYCIGASLAKHTVGATIKALLETFPSLELNSNLHVTWERGISLRSIKKLPVTLY